MLQSSLVHLLGQGKSSLTPSDLESKLRYAKAQSGTLALEEGEQSLKGQMQRCS